MTCQVSGHPEINWSSLELQIRGKNIAGAYKKSQASPVKEENRCPVLLMLGNRCSKSSPVNRSIQDAESLVSSEGFLLWNSPWALSQSLPDMLGLNPVLIQRGCLQESTAGERGWGWVKQVLGGKPRFQSFLWGPQARQLSRGPFPFTLSRFCVIPKVSIDRSHCLLY